LHSWSFYRRKLGGITGDLLGAMTEINEAITVSGGVRGRRSMIDGHGGNIYQLAQRLAAGRRTSAT
jgi:hypothetical protein